MKNKVSYIIFITILFISCKSKVQNLSLTSIKKDTLPVIINVEEARFNNEIPLLSDLSDNILYIKLKTPKSLIVRSINDIQISNDNILIHEGLSQTVMVFDKDGNFIKQIGKVGRGPNEYIHLKSFCVNRDCLLFYTGNRGDILEFNRNGDFIKKLFRYDNYADQMCSLDNILIFSGFLCTVMKNMPDNIFQFSTTNKAGHKIDSALLPIYSVKNWRINTSGFPGNFKATKYDNSFLLYGFGEDTIFHIKNNGKVEARYFLNFGKYATPLERRYVSIKIDDGSSHINGISSPFETSNNFLIKLALHGDAFLLRYDKVKRKAFTFFYKGDKKIDFARGRNSLDELGLVNDIDGGPDFFPKWSVYNDSTQLFISAHEVFDLKKELTPGYFENRKIKFPDKKDKLVELVNSLEEKDDYVLMIVKLK